VGFANGRECLSVEEAYQRWAAAYDCTPNPLLHLEERWLKILLPTVNDRRVLDLGCGTGRWLEYLLANGASGGVGVDSSAAMLRVATTKASIRSWVVRADCLQLPLVSAAFDIAVCSFALGHLSSLVPMALELARVLKKGADLFLADLHPAAYARGWRPGFRDDAGAVQIKMEHYSIETVTSCFCSVGFALSFPHEFFFGEPERPIFIQSGKEKVFETASQIPAIVIYQFELH
jgi:ubiquinone/menaquinone biosynthesis C-methylase UbiE